MATEQVKIFGTLLFKRGIQADLEADSSIIDNGEPVFEIDTKRSKVGNGELTYVDLPYIGGNEWCEEQIAQLTLRVEEAEETIEAFLRDAEVGSEAVDTLKEIQASLDAGEVSAANLLNKVNELETVHETYVEEHKKIREEFAAADSVVATALNEEISRAQTAETELDARLDIIEGTGEGSIKKAQADAQAYADTQITNLVDSAPEAMNTLNELAKAIEDNKDVYDAYVAEHAIAMANLETNLKAYVDAKIGEVENGSY